MATIYENLDTIKNSINRMKVALELTETTPLEEVTTFVEEGGGGVDITEYFYEEVTNTSWSQVVKSIPAFEYDGSGTRCVGMFNGCKAISIDASKINTTGATSMIQMFYNSSFESLNLKHFDTSLVTDMNGVFQSCMATNIDLNGWDTSKVIKMNNMFYYCTNLQRLDIRTFDFTNVTNGDYMFGNPSKDASKVPSSCLIIVKDDTARNWIKARASWLNNIKTVAELEG